MSGTEKELKDYCEKFENAKITPIGFNNRVKMTIGSLSQHDKKLGEELKKAREATKDAKELAYDSVDIISAWYGWHEDKKAMKESLRLQPISTMIKESAAPVNENYGDVLVDICQAFKTAEGLMKGSDVSPIEIWIDAGVRLGHITEAQGDELKNAKK